MKFGCTTFLVPFGATRTGATAASLCATRLWHTVHQMPASACTLWSMMRPGSGETLRLPEWHWVHCWLPISRPPLSASAEPGFSGSEKVFPTVGMTSRPDFTLATRKVKVSALTGSWQAMQDISAWAEALYAAMVSSWTLWQTSAQNQRVDVAPN